MSKSARIDWKARTYLVCPMVVAEADCLLSVHENSAPVLNQRQRPLCHWEWDKRKEKEKQKDKDKGLNSIKADSFKCSLNQLAGTNKNFELMDAKYCMREYFRKSLKQTFFIWNEPLPLLSSFLSDLLSDICWERESLRSFSLIRSASSTVHVQGAGK